MGKVRFAAERCLTGLPAQWFMILNVHPSHIVVRLYNGTMQPDSCNLNQYNMAFNNSHFWIAAIGRAFVVKLPRSFLRPHLLWGNDICVFHNFATLSMHKRWKFLPTEDGAAFMVPTCSQFYGCWWPQQRRYINSERRTLFRYPIGCLIVRSREVSKLRDW